MESLVARLAVSYPESRADKLFDITERRKPVQIKRFQVWKPTAEEINESMPTKLFTHGKWDADRVVKQLKEFSSPFYCA